MYLLRTPENAGDFETALTKMDEGRLFGDIKNKFSWLEKLPIFLLNSASPSHLAC